MSRELDILNQIRHFENSLPQWDIDIINTRGGYKLILRIGAFTLHEPRVFSIHRDARDAALELQRALSLRQGRKFGD